MLVVEDDCLLKKSFADFEALVADVEANIVQLDYALDALRESVVSEVSEALINGFGGRGEYALITNAAGAELLYGYLIHKAPEDAFHLDQKLYEIETPPDAVYAVKDPDWVTRRAHQDSDRIEANIANWEKHADVFLAEGVPAAAWRKRFIGDYRRGDV